MAHTGAPHQGHCLAGSGAHRGNRHPLSCMHRDLLVISTPTGPGLLCILNPGLQPLETKAWGNQGRAGAGCQLDSYAPPAGPAQENNLEHPSLPSPSRMPPPWSSFRLIAGPTPVIKQHACCLIPWAAVLRADLLTAPTIPS